MSSWLAWATQNCISKNNNNSYIWARPTSFQDFKITSFQKRMFGPKDAQMTVWTLPDGSGEAGTWYDAHCSCVREIPGLCTAHITADTRHHCPESQNARLGPAALSELLNFSVLILEEDFFFFHLPLIQRLPVPRTSLKKPLVSRVTKSSCMYIFFVP